MKLKWYLRQLLPLRYESEYSDKDGKKLTIWKMWFGKCYNIRTWNLA